MTETLVLTHAVGGRRIEGPPAFVQRNPADPADLAVEGPEASAARSDVATPGSTMWRLRMPVRCRIHSSLVSTIFSRSAFVSVRGGR